MASASADTSVPALELVTFQDFTQLSFSLASLIEPDHRQQPYDLLVTINRGGAVVSRFLSDYLSLQLASFGISSYVGINSQRELKVIQALNADLTDKKVLLVDEICDTGKTFQTAVDIVQKLQPREIKTAALFYKPHSVYKPDYIVETTEKWVVFPYEIRETIAALRHFWQTDPATKANLMNYFQTLGLSPQHISQLQTWMEHI